MSKRNRSPEEQARREKMEDNLQSSDSENISDNENIQVITQEENNDNKDSSVYFQNVNINDKKFEEKKDEEKIIFNNNSRPNSDRKLTRRDKAKKKLNTHIVQKRISLIEDEISLNFSKEDNNVQVPKHFKRRNRTIRYKLQTMMNQMHNKFFNTIININSSL